MTQRIPWWQRTLLADELDKAADALIGDAHDLDGRFAPEHHDAVRTRKLAAADDVRAYAQRIRTTEGDLTEQENRQAKTIANAARCSGILTDSPVPHRGFAEDDDSYGAGLRHWADGNATKTSLVDSGDMVRVADPAQLPFFALAAYGGATWEETGRDGAPQAKPELVAYRQQEEKARQAAHHAVGLADQGSHSWTSAIAETGLDTYRSPDKWTLQDRAELSAAQAAPSPAACRVDADEDGCEP